jgi:hypothetical protein
MSDLPSRHPEALFEEIARLKAEVERLKAMYRNTERWMLVDGEFEAAKVGTYARLKAEVERLTKAGNQSIAVGTKLREMVGDHHWSLEFDRVRTDWYHASRGVLSRLQNPNTPPTAV